MTEPLAHTVFAEETSKLVKTVAAAALAEDPQSQGLAILCVGYDQIRQEWMIQSNIRAEGFTRFLDNLVHHAKKHESDIAAASKALDDKVGHA